MPFPDYASFLRSFLDAGYACAPMTAAEPAAEGTLFLRHDIDFDIGYARALAHVEAELGIASTYYFMMSSDSYNLFSQRNVAMVREINSLGHKVSLHFDPLVYDDFVEGLQTEALFFKQQFGQDLDIISIHRPNEFFLSHDKAICGIAHTYQRRYCANLFYSSDSQGRWRFGDPRQSEAFAARRSIHLLIHPIWWVRPEAEPQAQLDGYVGERIERFIEHIEGNCRSYSATRSSHRRERGR